MSYINPITDFSITLNQLPDQSVAHGIRAQIQNQLDFESYWTSMLDHIISEVENCQSLDLTMFQREFLLTLLQNTRDNAIENGDEYKEI